ncbi:site-2 protease family protein [Agrococcus sp. Marseille-Q4369]|uniref:M50 family metallopeptidase n=1 Tax=Agrococcus sp. Marseille-Q4369 TaxID=2810513 RepID=UPI001B8C9688|nr:site-2 protease family protein [Agrococcus sp. Marseille-Q4369]QUW19611.1 site-2 protease family protein [Agrococcus sp. Marseille-Q4369]
MEAVLLYVVGVLVVVIGLAVSIGLHEIGHLVPAKLFGVRVGQWMIGFGPTLFSKRFGETEYGVKAIPLGGYISMSGMFPPLKVGGESRDASTGFFDALVQDARDSSAETIHEGEEERAFWRLATWKRIAIMLGGPLMNLVLAVVLYAIVLCGFGIAVPSTTVASVSECVIAASEERAECEPGDPLAPAAEAGVQPGDTIVSIDGQPAGSWDDVQAAIRDLAGQRVELVVERDGARQALQLTPLATERYVFDDRGDPVEVDGRQRTETVGFAGVGPQYEVAQQPASAVLPAVGDNVWRVGQLIVNLPQRLVDVAAAAFGPGERDPNGPMSVVGVGRMAGEIAALDQVPVLERISAMVQLLASLNVALFVFNLIPLMPLDGGHILGAVVDAVRRGWARLRGTVATPLDTAKWVPVTLVVTGLLGIMSALLIYADIVKPIALFGG